MKKKLKAEGKKEQTEKTLKVTKKTNRVESLFRPLKCQCAHYENNLSDPSVLSPTIMSTMVYSSHELILHGPSFIVAFQAKYECVSYFLHNFLHIFFSCSFSFGFGLSKLIFVMRLSVCVHCIFRMRLYFHEHNRVRRFFVMCQLHRL